MNTPALEQQVNLYQPILGAERRLFSARAIGVALGVFAVSLLGMSVYASRRTTEVERAVDAIEKRAAATLTMTESASQAVRPTSSQADLDARAKRLSTDIDLRQRSLELVERSSASPGTGFAARLEALAHRRVEGVWLSALSVGGAEGGLAMRGAATRPALLPAYLAGLAAEPALNGVHFDKLNMRHATPAELPAAVVFELGGPGLKLADKEPATPPENAK